LPSGEISTSRCAALLYSHIIIRWLTGSGSSAFAESASQKISDATATSLHPEEKSLQAMGYLALKDC